VADKPDPLRDEKLKAAMAGLGQWFYDEVYAANIELQACLLAASEEADPTTAKTAHDACIARFHARLDDAEANLVRTRKAATDAINGRREGTPQAPAK
jgi:hypothetical protein